MLYCWVWLHLIRLGWPLPSSPHSLFATLSFSCDSTVIGQRSFLLSPKKSFLKMFRGFTLIFPMLPCGMRRTFNRVEWKCVLLLGGRHKSPISGRYIRVRWPQIRGAKEIPRLLFLTLHQLPIFATICRTSALCLSTADSFKRTMAGKRNGVKVLLFPKNWISWLLICQRWSWDCIHQVSELFVLGLPAEATRFRLLFPLFGRRN